MAHSMRVRGRRGASRGWRHGCRCLSFFHKLPEDWFLPRLLTASFSECKKGVPVWFGVWGRASLGFVLGRGTFDGGAGLLLGDEDLALAEIELEPRAALHVSEELVVECGALLRGELGAPAEGLRDFAPSRNGRYRVTFRL